MTLDFTFKKYGELCGVIADSDYVLLTLEDYFSLEMLPEKFIIIRHDVDDESEYALKMAKLENSLKIKSTYYFRITENVFKKDIIQKISRLGHEVGYHYEVLDDACGNYAQAIEIFKNNLKKFNEVVIVKTIAQHGSPLIGNLNATSVSGLCKIVKSLILGNKVFTDWVNADIWKEYDLQDFKIMGEAYVSMDFKDVLYLTDTGMSWNNKYRIKDVVNTELSDICMDYKVKNTMDIVNLINCHKENHIYILVHADQWRDNMFDWVKWTIFKYIRNAGKFGLKCFAK